MPVHPKCATTKPGWINLGETVALAVAVVADAVVGVVVKDAVKKSGAQKIATAILSAKAIVAVDQTVDLHVQVLAPVQAVAVSGPR